VTVDGREVSAILAGDHFGDVALLSDGVNPATVVAETPMSLVVVSSTEFSGLLDRSPAVARAVLHNLAGRLRAA
jgi:CRP-like cAMP-binding protein